MRDRQRDDCSCPDSNVHVYIYHIHAHLETHAHMFTVRTFCFVALLFLISSCFLSDLQQTNERKQAFLFSVGTCGFRLPSLCSSHIDKLSLSLSFSLPHSILLICYSLSSLSLSLSYWHVCAYLFTLCTGSPLLPFFFFFFCFIYLSLACPNRELNKHSFIHSFILSPSSVNKTKKAKRNKSSSS